MALTFAQFTVEAVNAGVTSIARPFASTTAGSMLFAHVLTTAFNNPCTVTDSLSNVWTPLGHVSAPFGNPAQMFWAANPSGGAVTVTGHSPVSTTMAMFIFEYTGQAASSPVDAVLGSDHWTEIGTGNVSYGPITVSYTNEGLILAGRSDLGGVTVTPQDGATSRIVGTSDLLTDRNISTPGLYTAVFSTNVSNSTGEFTLIAVKTTASALPPSGGGSILGGPSDFKFKL